MTLIDIKDVSISYFEKQLYKNVTFEINEGDKVIILGENGSGKTTLLKLILGIEKGDSGSIEIAEGLKITYLDQFFPIKGDSIVKDLLNQPFQYIIDVEKEMNHIAEKLGDNPELMDVYTEKLEEFESKGGYDYITTLEKFISIFGFTDLLEREFITLSGGEKQYLRLAMTIFGEGDIIVLDEPSTFFDKKKNKWLINYINESDKTFLIVAHEQEFMLSVPNKIIDIDNMEVKCYETNYKNFLNEKKEYLVKQKEENDLADELIDSKKAALAKKCYWMEEAENKHAHAVTIRRLEREIKKLEDSKFVFVDNMEYTYTIKPSNKFKENNEIWISFKDVVMEMEDKLLYKKVNFDFREKDRIVITGDNGVGKTTFVKMIIGELKPTSGELTVDKNINIAYVSQDAFFEDDNMTVIDYCKKISHVGDILLEEYIDKLFDNDEDYRIKRLYMLSGGESKRLQILSHIIQGAELLIVDEPTTFMDAYSKGKIIELLEAFDGGIILITHDSQLTKELGFPRYRIENNRFNRNS